MKIILPAALALALAVPAVASATVIPPGLVGPHDGLLIRTGGKGKHHGKGHDYRRDDRDYDDWDDRRDERRAYRQGYREGRREARWNDGYRPGYDYGRRRYSRGQYLPPEYRRYVITEYRDYGYPPPPRGCGYVQVGQDTYLMQIATGLILNAFLGGRY